ncbi:hypothetical protein [Actinoplanes sp. NPDC051859]|uniref:hypothetical protein n=1 Tax=Actinoplanes sp. NPDC051859 TaxID=3363909 RepID=UPI0037A053CC
MFRFLARLMLPVALVASALTAPALAAPAQAAVTPTAAASRCAKPVVYFDLGNVLIDTSDWTKVRYVDGALEYLDELKNSHITLGLIINIPESWGTTQKKKLATMKKYIADRWVDEDPFVWSYFEGHIVLPRNDAERKPAPVMFKRARAAVYPCKSYYQGEVDEEVAVADQAGLVTYRVNQLGKPFYLPATQIQP